MAKSKRGLVIEDADRPDPIHEAIELIDALITDLEEAHEDELANDHYGDGDKNTAGCLYCGNIARARAFLEAQRLPDDLIDFAHTVALGNTEYDRLQEMAALLVARAAVR